MSERQLVCACEDVSLKDVHAAIALGHTDMESVKRYAGLATGICQGRSCLAETAKILAEHGTPHIRPTTTRAPLNPTTLGHLAAGDDLPPIYPSIEAPALTQAARLPDAPRDLPPLPTRAQIVIIGGGIIGLSLAYHLTKFGINDVVVLERGYLNAGASGRNGGGVRCQWSTENNVLLMKEAMSRCRDFASELGINVWLRQGGYVFLAQTQAQKDLLEQHTALQNRLGVRTRMLTRQQTEKQVTHLWCGDVEAAAYNPDDGVIFPWPFLWGYANRAQEAGAHVATFTNATGIEVTNQHVTAVHTNRGTVQCDLVVNAAAAWAKEVAALADVELPNKPERHEILVTESFKPCLDPLVTEISTGLYFSQSMRGELVIGMGDPKQPEAVEMRSSLRFITAAARALVRRMPILSQVQVIRQWAGCYDVTPDGNPIVGELGTPRGFFQLHGFVGHGFMMAPAVGYRIAKLLARGESDAWIKSSHPDRFKDPKSLKHETMIIG